MSAPKKQTWAIRYKKDHTLYVCKSKSQSGYEYCCPCKETEQFPNKTSATKFMAGHKISETDHEIIDSVTATAEKAKRRK